MVYLSPDVIMFLLDFLFYMLHSLSIKTHFSFKGAFTNIYYIQFDFNAVVMGLINKLALAVYQNCMCA